MKCKHCGISLECKPEIETGVCDYCTEDELEIQVARLTAQRDLLLAIRGAVMRCDGTIKSWGRVNSALDAYDEAM